MLVLEANEFRSMVLMNQGGGKFTLQPLPMQAQWSPINGIAVADVDDDEFPDLVLSTNDYGTEVTVGRYDALNGLVLKGDGKGGFVVLGQDQAGFRVPADGKALAVLASADGSMMVAASQNKGPLKVFKHSFPGKSIPLQAGDASAILQLRSGASRKVELYYGQGFLGQSARRMFLGPVVTRAEISNNTSGKRTVQ